MFSSCDLTADKKAQVSFKQRQALSEMGPKAHATAQFNSSSKARNWARTRDDFSSAFIIEAAPEPRPPVQAPPAAETLPAQPTSSSGEKTASVIYASPQSLAKLTHLAA